MMERFPVGGWEVGKIFEFVLGEGWPLRGG
jgi:hypothetical protein